jgi:putative heme-binding domain-containing protein
MTTAAEPDPNDPAAELASFRLAEGFEANLFASEKDGVVKPIQIRWDTRGRLWVIQSTTYPQLKPGEEPNDKVLILEDTDGDGRADKTTVFADGLMIPTGLEIAPVDGTAEAQRRREGEKEADDKTSSSSPRLRASAVFPSACYVGEGTKLWLLTDTDGDGKCDKREVVLRGFGTGDNHQNINSFRWSPGGELFFSQGLHAFSRVETPHGIVALDHAGFFRYRPREHRLDAFYGGHADPQNPWGFVWTDWGQMLMVAGNNGGIFWPLPEMIRGVQNGKRDNLWVNARGRKTSGPDIVGTAHFPPEWQGVMLTGGYINNTIWALKIEDDGAGFRISDLPKSEVGSGKSEVEEARVHSPPTSDLRLPTSPLLTSTSTSFRPVDVKFGPDGALYVCDWFNPIIGHYQASFRHPDRDKTHGRIWRITAKGRPLVKPPPIAGAPVEALLENLKSPERYVREQSKRELAGRKTEEVVEKARKWCRATLLGTAREGADATHALTDRDLIELLGVFEAHDAPDKELLLHLVRAKSPVARASAMEAIGRWIGVLVNDWSVMIVDGVGDEDPRVRLVAVVSAAEIVGEKALHPIEVMRMPEQDKFVLFAARNVVAARKPEAEQLLAKAKAEGSRRWEQIAALLHPAAEAKPTARSAGAPLAPSVIPKPPAVAATGQLRATPEFVAALVKEVRESGDAKRGAEVFRRAELTCTACHSIEDQGGKIGPPLDTIGSGQPLDFIIGATLEPQREIKDSYEALQMTAKDGRVAIGYIAQRTAEGTTLRDPATGAETRFAAAEIAELKPLGSFMPAGLVDRLSREDLRDLFRYLSELGKPR